MVPSTIVPILPRETILPRVPTQVANLPVVVNTHYQPSLMFVAKERNLPQSAAPERYLLESLLCH
jgi:hypothetical protein